MELIQSLTQFGLSDKEARIYRALLPLGTANVTEIATRADVKRPTAYVVLSELHQRSLVSEVKSGKEKLYTAVQPNELRLQLAARLTAFDAALPKLTKLVTSQVGRPQVKVLEGKQKMIDAWYRSIKSPDELLFLSNIDALVTEFDQFLPEILSVLRQYQHPFRELVGATRLGRKHARTTQKDLPFGEVRLLAAPLSSDIVVSGETVLISSFAANNFYVVSIENPLIAASYRTLFEQLWKHAKQVH